MAGTQTPAAPAFGDGWKTAERLKIKLKDALDRLKAAEDRAVKLETDVSEARKAAQTAEERYNADTLKSENDRLKADIRTGRHRAVFNEVATSAGASKDTLDLLWRESGWAADSDEPDAQAIGKAVEGLKGRADLSRLFGEAPAPAQPERRPAPGRGQGAPNGGTGRIKATTAQIRDADWCWHNREALRQGLVDQID